MELPDHRLGRLRVLALLLECGSGRLVGDDHPAAVHLPGEEQLRPPRPLPAASLCGRWSWGRGRGRAAGGGTGDGSPDGEVAVLLRVVVEPRQLFGRRRSHVAGAAVGTEASGAAAVTGKGRERTPRSM